MCVLSRKSKKDETLSGDYQKQTSPVKAVPSNLCDSSSLEVVNTCLDKIMTNYETKFKDSKSLTEHND